MKEDMVTSKLKLTYGDVTYIGGDYYRGTNKLLYFNKYNGLHEFEIGNRDFIDLINYNSKNKDSNYIIIKDGNTVGSIYHMVVKYVKRKNYLMRFGLKIGLEEYILLIANNKAIIEYSGFEANHIGYVHGILDVRDELMYYNIEELFKEEIEEIVKGHSKFNGIYIERNEGVGKNGDSGNLVVVNIRNTEKQEITEHELGYYYDNNFLELMDKAKRFKLTVGR